MATDDSTTRFLKALAATIVMLVLGSLIAPKLSSWQSHRLADQIAQRVAEAKDGKVKVPLRQLADLGKNAIEPLVVAATSERAAVAAVARQILDEKRAAWEGANEASSTAMLATALATHIEEFGPAGKQWAERIALAMIDQADRLPAEHTPILLEHCSQVLAAVPPRGPRLRTLATRTKLAQPTTPAQLLAPEPKLESMTHRSESRLEVLPYVPPRVPAAIRNQLVRVAPQGRETRTPLAEPLHWSGRSKGRSKGEFQRLSPAPENTLAVATHQPQNLARPVKVNTGVVDIPNPQDMAKRTVALRELSSVALLRRLQKSSFYEAGIIRTILVERGYDDAELALRQQLTSPKVADRLQLVEEVSQLSASTASRVLRWLLEDKSGEVRLRALTALATTSSPDLNRLARGLAASDEDPRVAKLASRLLRQSR